MRNAAMMVIGALVLMMMDVGQAKSWGWGLKTYTHADLGVQFAYPSSWVILPPPNEETKKASEEAIQKLLGGHADETIQLVDELGIQTVDKLVKPQAADGPRIPTSLAVMLMPSASPLWETDKDALQREMASEALEMYADGGMEINFTTVSSTTDYVAYKLWGKVQTIPINQEFIVFRPRKGKDLTCAIVITYENLKDRKELAAIVESIKLGSL